MLCSIRITRTRRAIVAVGTSRASEAACEAAPRVCEPRESFGGQQEIICIARTVHRSSTRLAQVFHSRGDSLRHIAAATLLFALVFAPLRAQTVDPRGVYRV